jgi:4-hydroxy-tetrahydrodipicolinate synthase
MTTARTCHHHRGLPGPAHPLRCRRRARSRRLATLVRYLLRSGVDGMTFPGVASEVATLSEAERAELTALVIREVAGRVPVVAGVSSNDAAVTLRLAKLAAGQGAAALMIAAPATLKTAAEQIAHFQAIAAAVPGTALMLQNVPPPAGAGLDPAVLLEILAAVPEIRYIKEEALPSGQRLTEVLAARRPRCWACWAVPAGATSPTSCAGAPAAPCRRSSWPRCMCGLFAAHRAGDAAAVRQLFTRMLPVLNIQAVFRWSLTKHVLHSRGLIGHTGQRTAGPLLDAQDRQDVDAFMADLADLLLAPAELAPLVQEGGHGAS